jgi:hypothetical protein
MTEPTNTATTPPAASNPNANMLGLAQADMPPHGSHHPCGIGNGLPARAQQEAQTSERQGSLPTVTKSPVNLPCRHTYDMNLNVHATKGPAPLKGLEMGLQTPKSTCSDVSVGTPASGGWESPGGHHGDMMTTTKGSEHTLHDTRPCYLNPSCVGADLIPNHPPFTAASDLLDIMLENDTDTRESIGTGLKQVRAEMHRGEVMPPGHFSTQKDRLTKPSATSSGGRRVREDGNDIL